MDLFSSYKDISAEYVICQARYEQLMRSVRNTGRLIDGAKFSAEVESALAFAVQKFSNAKVLLEKCEQLRNELCRRRRWAPELPARRGPFTVRNSLSAQLRREIEAKFPRRW